MKNNILISLDQNTTPELANSCGGKFSGLHKIADLIKKWQKEYDVDIQIPQTFAIPTDVYDKYDIKAKGVPEEIVNEAMQALVACGGCVAVRSSADIEDQEGKTNSGAFKSVLFVKNKTQMREALKKVYASAENVEDANMGIIIQPMIETPKMAGVAYSQDFNGDQMVVVNWTQGKPADYLLVNKEEGTVTKVAKYLNDKSSYDVSLELFTFDKINSDNDKEILHTAINNMMGPMSTMMLNSFGYKSLTSLVALCNHLEKELNYPVDLEFAIAENGKLNILQQRPYIMNPNYIVKNFDNGDWIGYNKKQPIVMGEVLVVDECSDKIRERMRNQEYDNKILLSKNSHSNSYFVLAYAREGMNSKLRIDAEYRIHNQVYGHYGNEFRENAQPFISTKRKEDFANVETGDYMKIDLRTGDFKIYPQKDKTFNVANVLQMLSNNKSK